eukprot:TRINITY_DN11786_c0_g1_i1.p1 TRINITY_DN11786_c0_g1~~TRINITY_DN11786_c0_g1_i1.p1  ORF type:complete len:372 (+),score=61.81 TRINITY_DN11786_c0_g1_i1:38-1153(+)
MKVAVLVVLFFGALVVCESFSLHKYLRRHAEAKIAQKARRAPDCRIPNWLDDFECIAQGGTCPSNNDCNDLNSNVCAYCKGLSDGECTPGTICPDSYDGMDCSDDEGCTGFLSNTPAICVNSTCMTISDFKQNNDPCTDDSECFGSLKCDATTKKCIGLETGENCNNDLECKSDDYCKPTNDKCTPKIEIGKACTENDQCESLAECNDGKCTDIYSVGAGGVCDEATMCKTGLVCTFDEKCALRFDGGAACDPDADPEPCREVNEGSTCNCDATDGEFKCSANSIWGDLDSCKNALESAFECAKTNDCGTNGGAAFWEGTCFNENCASDVNEYFDCFLGSLETTGFLEKIFSCVFDERGSASSLSSFMQWL